ncbi:MAG: septum formation family protein [Nocardioides sp.]
MSHGVRIGLSLASATLALVLGACSGSGSSTPEAGPTPADASSPTPTQTVPARPEKPPKVGSCYRLGYAEALAPTLDKRPATCGGVHTAVTFYVGSLRAHVATDSARARRLESTVCPRRFATFVGGTLDQRRVSMLRTVWFGPSTEQAGVGAHWFVCTAIALRGDQNLALLRGPLHGVLAASTGRDHYGICGTAEPGTAGFEQRICASPHSWRALRTIAFPPGRYPGAAHVQSAGKETCQNAANDVASDPLHYTWSYQWPSREQWKAGQTYGVCWAPGH